MAGHRSIVGRLSVIACTGNIYAGLYYPMIVTAITLVVGSIFLKETRGHKIWEEVATIRVSSPHVSKGNARTMHRD